MSKLPLVSIVTPSWNQARFLPLTLDSVLAQSYSHIEYLVLDGGSTDGSVDVLRRYRDRLSYWVSKPDQGQADAINRGWQKSSGEILAWINSDDTYEPEAVSHIVDIFARHPEVDIVTGDCRVIDDTGSVLYDLPSGEFDIRTILAGNSLPQQGVFCRRTAVEAAGWLDTELHYVFDWVLWLKLWLNDAKYYHLPQIIANFRLWGGSKTSAGALGVSLSGGRPFAYERLIALDKLLKQIPVQSESVSRDLLQSAHTGNLLELALLHCLAGQNTEAFCYIMQYEEAKPGKRLSMFHAQALAAHLAFIAEEQHCVINRFVELMRDILSNSGISFDAEQWQRAIRRETYLTRAWHQMHLGAYDRSLSFFLLGIFTDPSLLFQRRVLSPVSRLIQKVATNHRS